MPRLQNVGVHIEVGYIDFEYGLNGPGGITNGWHGAVKDVEFEDPFQRTMEPLFSIEWMHHDQGDEGFRYDITYSPKKTGTEIVGMSVKIYIAPGNGSIRGARIKYVAIGA
jgi:hypothetical protein